jgi:hypothetical protein
MGLSYYFTFSAAATVPVEELMTFLKSVEANAKRMGFKPTLLLNATFDTSDRRDFARDALSPASTLRMTG